MNYFYLDGLEKIGPLTIEELRKVSLTDDTLIWFDSINNWTKLSDLLELKREIYGDEEEREKTPPPIPQEIIEKQKLTIKEQEINDKRKTKFLIVQVGISLLFFLITIFIINIIISNKEKASKKELTDKVEFVFQGKTTVCDGQRYTLIGNLKKVKKSIFNEGIEEFELINGGFTICEISKEDDGYVISDTYAKNLIYKVSEFEYKFGYYLPTYRPTVERCYADVFDHLTINNKKVNFVANTYNLIQNFTQLKSDLFFIINAVKPTSPKTYEWWQKDAGSVFTSQYSLQLSKIFRYYEITKNSTEIKKLLYHYILIGFLIASVLTIIFNVIINIYKKR